MYRTYITCACIYMYIYIYYIYICAYIVYKSIRLYTFVAKNGGTSPPWKSLKSWAAPGPRRARRARRAGRRIPGHHWPRRAGDSPKKSASWGYDGENSGRYTSQNCHVFDLN